MRATRAIPRPAQRNSYRKLAMAGRSGCSDFYCKTAAKLLLRHEKIVASLEIHPELRRRSEAARQTQCGVGGDPALAVDNVSDAARRHPEFEGESVGAQLACRHF